MAGHARGGGLTNGVYETSYGNAAYVSGPYATTAYDLDMGERIPITEVTAKWLRPAEPTDRVRRSNCYDMPRSF